MNSITVRAVDSVNFHQLIPGIVQIFRDDEAVPWHRYDECHAWVKRRAERGFYITAAWYDGQIAGYCEWIETYDNGKKILYLGVMQVDCGLRGRGIGGAMLNHGAEYAKSIGASRLRTIPEDERSYGFYKKNGFAETNAIDYCVCASINSNTAQNGEAAPMTREIADTCEFVFGLCQSSGRHMYEVANHPPETVEFNVKTSHIPGGYLQFRYREGSKTALALYWSGESVTAETVSGILAQGDRAGFEKIEFYFKSKYSALFPGRTVTRESVEMEREIG